MQQINIYGKIWMQMLEHPDSDVDILVSFVPGAKMGLSYFGMICDLEDLLHRPVDLVVEGDLLPFAVESANKDKILVYEQQVEGYLRENDI